MVSIDLEDGGDDQPIGSGGDLAQQPERRARAPARRRGEFSGEHGPPELIGVFAGRPASRLLSQRKGGRRHLYFTGGRGNSVDAAPGIEGRTGHAELVDRRVDRLRASVRDGVGVVVLEQDAGGRGRLPARWPRTSCRIRRCGGRRTTPGSHSMGNRGCRSSHPTARRRVP